MTQTFITIGNVVSALAITFAIQQFLKPIHRFRMRVRGFPISTFYLMLFSAAGFVFIGNGWRYASPDGVAPPVFELAGAALFLLAYGLVAYLSLSPVRLTPSNADRYYQATQQLLSRANAEDYVAFFSDLARSWLQLLRTLIEHEKFTSGSAKSTTPKDAKAKKYSAQASRLFSVLAEPTFCAILVKHAPTTLTESIKTISMHQIASTSAIPFVQQVAQQAVRNDDSILQRELSYSAGSTRSFLDAVFGDAFIHSNYRPVRYGFADEDRLGETIYLDRLANVFRRTWRADRTNVKPDTIQVLAFDYPNVIRRMSWPNQNSTPLLMETVGLIAQDTIAYVDSLEEEDKAKLLQETEVMEENVAESTAYLVTISIDAIQRRLEKKETNYGHIQRMLGRAFPFRDDRIIALNAVHVHLIRQLTNSFRINLHNGEGGGGFDVIIPLLDFLEFRGRRPAPEGSPYRLLEDATFHLLRNLPSIYEERGEELNAQFPSTIRYDAESNELTFAERYGSATMRISINDLAAIHVPETLRPPSER